MKLPDWLIHDIKFLRGLPNIGNLSYSNKGEFVEVRFDFQYDQYAQIEDERLLNPEPIMLKYELGESPKCPSFLSDRDDFPRDLPHLNPVEDNEPASICLWRKGSNASLYIQKGIYECIIILSAWLKDASISRLQRDGWEPTPRDGAISFNIDLSTWQSFALLEKFNKKICSVSTTVFIDKFSKINMLFGFAVPSTDPKIKAVNLPFLRPLQYGRPIKIKTHYVVSDKSFIETKHNSMIINSFDDLVAYSSNSALIQIKHLISKEKKKQGISATIILIAQRRPLPLIEEIPSLSKDSEARKIELTAILVTHENNKFEFNQLVIKSSATTELLSKVSGLTPLEKEVSLIGCGSVGGAVADYLVRSGHSKINLWDADLFEPHNNTRHILSQNLFDGSLVFTEFKVKKMEQHLKNINNKLQLNCFPHSFDTGQLSHLISSDQIIDTTGEIVEPTWLGKLTIPYSRIFIADEGRLSFLMSQLPSEVEDILDLEAVIYSLARQEVKIRSWLQRQSLLSNKMLGLSCSSSTLEMPWFRINNHVSALMPTLRQQILKPEVRVVMNSQDKDGNPEGMMIFDTSSNDFNFQKFSIEDLDGNSWIVTINDKCTKLINDFRQSNIPNESSGYIFGLYHLSERRISLVDATIGIFQGTRTFVSLETIEQDKEAQAILQTTNEMLLPLGTWHSHPGNSAAPSQKDKSTFAELLDCDERIIPTVMLIKANEELRIIVGLNRNI